jgi:hypothetical protein
MSIDWAREKYEIRLEHPWSLSYRLGAAASALLIVAISFLLAEDRGTQVMVAFICGVVIAVSLLKSNVRWTIRSGEILIERNWIDGRQRVELVERADITNITILVGSSEAGTAIWFLLRRYSGLDTESPTAPIGMLAEELKTAVETRLNVTVAIKSHMTGLLRTS